MNICMPFLGALACALSAPTENVVPDWNRWRGADGSGLCREVDWVTEGAKQALWEVDAGLGYSGVCLAGGVLTTIGFNRQAGKDVVRALDPLTGKELWRHSYPAELNDNMHAGGSLNTPVAEDDWVFVLSRTGVLWALDLQDGKPRWSVDLKANHQVDTGYFGLCASPTVLEEGLLINVGKTMLFAKDSGKLLWSTDDYGYSYSSPVPMSWGDNRCLAVFNAKGLALLERKDGKERALFPWTSKFNVNCSVPIPMGSRVFISTGYDDKGCALLDFAKGPAEVIWESKAMRSNMTGPVLRSEVLYGFDKSLFKALDLEGKTLWKERGMGNGAFRMCVDGRVAILTEEGELVMAQAEPEGFEELSRRPLFEGGKCWTSPVIAGGLIFCRNSAGALVCLDHRKPDAR